MGRKISIADLRKIHEEHKIWLNTVGADKTESGQSE
jgi:hypothetical protein